MWGKYKEFKEKEAEEIQEAVKVNNNNNNIAMKIEDIEANSSIDDQIETNEGNNNRMYFPAVAISGPIPHTPMIAIEAPKP